MRKRLDRKGHKQKTIIEIYLDAERKYRWRVTARNGRIIGASSQGYEHRRGCIRNADDVQRAMQALVVDESFVQQHPERAFGVIDRIKHG